MIPVHNGADYLADAIASVLTQTHAPLECIVVDDGSTDATADEAARFGDPVRVLRQPRSGVASARNRGAREARGELVAFLDHDDVWRPEKTAAQIAAAGASTALTLCAVEVVGPALEPRRVQRIADVDALLEAMLLFDRDGPLSCSSTGLVRRERFAALGGFDERLGMSADWDLLRRCLTAGRVTYVDEPLTLYREHATNMSRQVDALDRDMRLAFAKAFADPALPPALQARRREAFGRMHRMLAGSYRQAGMRGPAVRHALAAARTHPRLLVEEAQSCIRGWRSNDAGSDQRASS